MTEQKLWFECLVENVWTQILTQFVHGPLILISRVDKLHFELINCYGIIRPSWKAMPKRFGKIITLKHSDTKIRVISRLIAMVWRGKCKHADENALANSRGWFPWWAWKCSEASHSSSLWESQEVVFTNWTAWWTRTPLAYTTGSGQNFIFHLLKLTFQNSFITENCCSDSSDLRWYRT
jgi:hypothetical protein